MDSLTWLQKWYVNQCDGDWEHCYGVRIETLDNPGWSVMISVVNTVVEGKIFEKINIKRNEMDWINCEIDYVDEQDGLHFLGYGGPENLEEILDVFKDWVES